MKFRVWDKNNCEMIFNVGITPNKIPYTIPALACNSEEFHYYENAVIMQSTGMKDKNGIEIYEGDIVKLKDNRNYDVIATIQYELSTASYHFLFQGGTCWQIYDFYRGDKHKMVGAEVIGNIYSTPELLIRKRIDG